MTKYFAIIDSECKGPFLLEELQEAGVAPETYVWSKKMPDWQMARDVEEIRNYTRMVLARKKHEAEAAQRVEKEKSVSLKSGKSFRRFGIDFEIVEEKVDTTYPPQVSIVSAILVMFFCFPITGLVALIYAIKSRKEWAKAERGETTGERNLYTPKEMEECKLRSYHYALQSKMWVGISFFLGFIVYAVLLNR